MRGIPLHIFLLISTFLPLTLAGQLRVEIVEWPEFTPTTDTLYLTGSFNGWDIEDGRFAFQHDESTGIYFFDFLTPMPDFDFKINRGNWDNVEGGKFGTPINNRSYLSNGATRDTIRLSIASWEDLQDKINFLDTLRIEVTSVPENTPTDAVLFVTGSFNGWSPQDDNYRMQQLENGRYQATIPLRSDTTEFKISRGNWTSIEARANGYPAPNRRYLYQEGHERQQIRIDVANWEDLAGDRIGWQGIFLLLTALQALILLIGINSFPAQHPQAGRFLSAFILCTALAIAARVAGLDRAFLRAIPKLVLIPDLICFLIGPLYWLYLKALNADERLRLPTILPHLLPFFVGLVIYFPLFLLDDFTFTKQMVNLELSNHFGLVSGLAWVTNVIYWLIAYPVIKTIVLKYASIKDYLHTYYVLFAVTLVNWLIALLLGTWYNQQANYPNYLTDAWSGLSWLCFGGGIYVIGYFVIRQPGLFRKQVAPLTTATGRRTPNVTTLATAASPSDAKSEPQVSPDEVEALLTLMQKKQPFLNPGLSLAELAKITGTPPHQLSRVINEGCEMNFFDFVNDYRIKTFIQFLEAGLHEERTTLSLALDAGFNSKTAFNRAFKKKTGMTPRAYIKKTGK